MRPASHSPESAALAERRLAAGLLRNFLIALDAEPACRDAFMEFARQRAQHQLRAWGLDQ